jgi:outer membrane protein TolC
VSPAAAVLEARADIAAARNDDRSAREAVAQYRDGIRASSRLNLDVVRETLTLGRATMFDVLNEQRRYLEIERAYTSALQSAFEARTRLQLALGDVR